MATAADVASALELSLTVVEAELAALCGDSLVRRRGDRWSLLPTGRAFAEAACRAALDSEAQAAVRIGYTQFLAFNGPFMQLCNDWQLLDREAKGAATIAKLAALHTLVSPIVGDLGGALPRLGAYGPRLDRALARVQSGEHDWFTGAMIDSYHTVWFELHEDLLVTLGIERATEGS